MLMNVFNMFARRLILSLLVCTVLLEDSVFVQGQVECNNSTDGNVQLIGGVHDGVLEGRLEVCLNGEWGTVCNDDWDINDAIVVCRQLEIAEEDLNNIVTGLSFGGGPSNQPIHFEAPSCDGSESRLVDCGNVPRHNCEKAEDVGIICQRSEDCTDREVRLVDGDVPTEGRVEFCRGGQWGTVCDNTDSGNSWDENDVAVVCKQLGHFTLEPRVLTSVPAVDNLNTPIMMYDVECTGREDGLSDCQIRTAVEYCSHNNDVGANCTRNIECDDNDVRLVGGLVVNEGMVEFCRDGYWGEVCRDDWDVQDATVVCRELGYDVENGSALVMYFGLGDNFRRIWLYEIECNGNETSLSQCPHEESGTCIRTTAGVICPNRTVVECEDGQVRLRDGELSPNIGRVDVCFGGTWGQICHDQWEHKDAAVICRQLGHTGGIATTSSTFSSAFTDGSIRGITYHLDDVNCTGNESRIDECQHGGISRHDCGTKVGFIAGVICDTNPGEELEKCLLQHDNNTQSAPSSGNISITNFGTCEPYLGESELCRPFFSTDDYVFFKESDQEDLANELDKLSANIRQAEGNCSNLIAAAVCHYIFAPCGVDDEVYRPTSVCSDECIYVEQLCERQWNELQTLLRASSNINLGAMNCSATNQRLGYLSPCCIDAGIEVMDIPTEPPPTPTPSSGGASAGVIGGVVGAVLICLLLVLVLVAVVLYLCAAIARKKKVVRNLQMEVLSSPTARTTSADMLAAFGMKADEMDGAAKSMGSVKLRNGSSMRSTGSMRGPLAVPNPYASKQELAHELPPDLLNPGDNKMMNRISSSIIRELTSNMLIPYTRLKLLECVGQGEFGVVYKAEYTEPEGEISYKSTTVAVKTLKGFFDNDQVNKIMSESVKMKHFDHPNVLHLIGVCLDAGPAPYVVMPFMANGSLLHYLKKERSNIVLPHEVDEDVKIDVRKRLTVMCLQIANGMEYLAQEKFVHRDLAARNCMIDIHFVIKIADFGLSEDVYSKNYFRQTSDKHIKLPVKWMAPESLSDGVFSEKTDVWSFGVTSWEIFSGGKTPYPGMDPLLLSQMLDTEQRLNKPLNAACPDEIYAMMMHTWSKQPDDRPTFEQLVETISDYTEKIAGYLDINFNPFQSTSDLTALLEAEEEREKQDNNVLKSPEQLVAALDQPKKKKGGKLVSPKPSPKASPKVSPRVSPLPSPRVSPRTVSPSNLSQDEKNSVGIKIKIEGPSEAGSPTTETPV